MKFKFKSLSCDADVFTKDNDLIVKFYDISEVQTENQMINYVSVDPGYGYIHLKYIGEDAILSGHLNKDFFLAEENVNAAIDFVEKLSPLSDEAYIPHHVVLVDMVSFVEYNGEV